MAIIKTGLEAIVHIALIITMFVKFGAVVGFLYLFCGMWISLIIAEFVKIVLFSIILGIGMIARIFR